MNQASSLRNKVVATLCCTGTASVGVSRIVPPEQQVHVGITRRRQLPNFSILKGSMMKPTRHIAALAVLAVVAVSAPAADTATTEMKGMFPAEETEGMSGNTGRPKAIPEKTPAELAAEKAAAEKRKAFFDEKAAKEMTGMFPAEETQGMSGDYGTRAAKK